MPTVRRESVVKTVTVSQFEWSFKKGLIWNVDGELFSRLYEYRWVNPHIDSDGDHVAGHYEVIDSKLVDVNADGSPAAVAAKIHPFSDYYRAGLEQSIADA